MSDKTLYVHIGVHKTGSTAIQFHLACYAPLLRAWSLDYPRLTPAWTSRNNDIAGDAAAPDGGFPTLPRYLERVRRSRCRKLLISAERFYNQPGAIGYFSQFSSICRVRIVVFLRRQDCYIESMYRQMVKNGANSGRWPFKLYSARQVRKIAGSVMPDWRAQLRPWEEAFGRENVLVVAYSEGGFDSVAVMARVLGIPEFVRHLPFVPKNPSLSCEAVEFLRLADERGIATERGRLRQFDVLIPERSQAYYSPAERATVVNGFAASNREVGQHFACDMSPLLPESLERAPSRRVFAPEAFDFDRLLPWARKSGLVV